MTRADQTEWAYETVRKYPGYSLAELEQDFRDMSRIQPMPESAVIVLDDLQLAGRICAGVNATWFVPRDGLVELALRIRDQCDGLKVDHVAQACVVCTAKLGDGVYDVLQVRTWDDCRLWWPKAPLLAAKIDPHPADKAGQCLLF